MNSNGFNNNVHKGQNNGVRNSDLIGRIENAYRVYKLSEVFLSDVENDYGKDYGKLKIARLRLDFARHELLSVLKEAQEKGVRWNENEFIRKYFQPSAPINSTKDFLT